MNNNVNKIKLITRLSKTKLFNSDTFFNEEFFSLCDTLNYSDINKFIQYEKNYEEDYPFKMVTTCFHCYQSFTIHGKRKGLEDNIKYKCSLRKGGSHITKDNTFINFKYYCNDCQDIKLEEERLRNEKEEKDNKAYEIKEEKRQKKIDEESEKFNKRVQDLRDTQNEEAITFGQHKGKIFTDLDISYLVWLTANMDDKTDTCLRARIEISNRGYNEEDLLEEYKAKTKWKRNKPQTKRI